MRRENYGLSLTYIFEMDFEIKPAALGNGMDSLLKEGGEISVSIAPRNLTLELGRMTVISVEVGKTDKNRSEISCAIHKCNCY
jgi:hypothetical protein